jgi:hypothetical protein
MYAPEKIPKRTAKQIVTAKPTAGIHIARISTPEI